MNKQEFIELATNAVKKVVEQGKPSEDYFEGGCYYLSPEGLCCVVGHMMPNDEIRKAADQQGNSSIWNLQNYDFEWIRQFTTPQITCLTYLQTEHDAQPYDGISSTYENESMKIINEYANGGEE